MQKVTPQLTPPRCSAPFRRRHRRFTNTLAALGVASLAAGWISTASAGEHTYDFNTDPATSGFIIFGANAANAWHQTDGTGGPSDGWLEITPSANSQTLGILFPLDYFTNADNSIVALPLKGFELDCDVRIGNATGNNGRPADGFSISFAANTDPVVYWGKQGNFRGWAGGDSVAQALEPTTFNFATGQGAMDPSVCDSGTAENGVKTGVSVQFDTWSGNTIVDQTGNATAGNDNVGWRVHYNGKMISRVQAYPPTGALQFSPDPNGYDVNGLWVCPAANQPTDFLQDPSCAAAILADTNTIQTGPYTGDGDVTNLLWAHLSVSLTTNTTHVLTVTYKGRPLVDNLALTNFQPFVGQLIMGGRTGGANENRDVDNVHIITYPSVQAIFSGISSVSSYINDFSLLLQNIGPAKVTTINALTLDGVDIKAAAGTTITIGDPNSTIKYAPATPFVSGSQHTVSVTYSDAAGNTLTSTVAFTTTPWTVLPASAAVASVDTTKPGFLIYPHQTLEGEPNRLWWADEQLMGLHGTNIIDPGTLQNAVNGEVAWQSPIDFANSGAGGQFPLNIDWANLGIPGPAATSDNNSAIAATAYLYFPTPGMYIMGGNSDDGLRVTFAKNSHDLLGTQVPGLNFDGGRGVGTDQNVGAVIVTNAGYYGFRLLWENGGGGSAIEWYFKSTPAGSTNVLINDTLNNPQTAIVAYQVSSVAPPYVSYAEPPLGDDSVNPDSDFMWKLSDGTGSTVNSGSVVLKINGVQQAPTITSGSGVTTISLPHTPGQPHPAGTNTIEITFKDSANANYDYNYTYVVGGFTALPASAAADASTVDKTKPGFNMTLVQVDQQGGNSIPNREHVGEQVLAGLWGPSVATIQPNSYPPLPGFINFDIAGPDGDFQAPDFPDVQFPGLPGTGTAAHNLESYAVEYSAWVVFPAEGTYTLGVNSDDGFLTKIGTNRPTQIGQLTVVSPASVKGDQLAVLGDQIGTPNKTPLTGKLVLANDILGCVTPLANAAALAGNIALIERGTCSFQTKADAATAAGAIAVVIANNRPEVSSGDGWFPIEMGGGPADPIPALMIGRTNYFALTNAMASGDVVVTLQPYDKSGTLGEADYGKGASDVNYKVYVSKPGAYPLRTMYWQGGGGGNCEWYSILADGTHVLLNNTTNSASLLAYRAAVPPVNTTPTLSVSKSGGSYVLTFTGSLYSSSTVNGTFTKTSATSPYTIPSNTSIQFYRAGP